jgi:antitoxin component YwqK of YwqJK toxin-antitoxin module
MNHEVSPQLYNKLCLSAHIKNNQVQVKTEKLKQVLYPNGKVQFEIAKEKNELFIMYYDSTGVLTEKGQVDSTGKYNGSVTWFYSSGKVMRTGFYKNIFPYGNWREYYENGTLMSEYSYENGAKNGEQVYYHSNGKTWTKRVYKGDKLQAVDFILSIKGDTLDIGTFANGDGILNVYDEVGNLLQKVHYKKGLINFQEKM